MLRAGPYLLEMQSFMFSSHDGPRNPIIPITVILTGGLALTLLCIAVTIVASSTNTIFFTRLVARVAHMLMRLFLHRRNQEKYSKSTAESQTRNKGMGLVKPMW